MSAFTLREALPGDAPDLARLCGELGYPTTVAELRARWERLAGRPDHAVFVAEDTAGRVIGWIQMSASPNLESEPRAEIAGLVVESGRRGGGVGLALVRRGVQWAREQGLARVRVRSRIERTDAHRFYRRQGFEPTKVQQVFDLPVRND